MNVAPLFSVLYIVGYYLLLTIGGYGILAIPTQPPPRSHLHAATSTQPPPRSHLHAAISTPYPHNHIISRLRVGVSKLKYLAN